MKNSKLTLPKNLNLKLNKTVWFCLGGGVLLLALAFLGVMRLQQVTQQQQLTDELKQAKTRLAGLGITTLETQKEQLQKKVDDANAALQDNTQTLVQYMTSITGDETLFSLAMDCNLVVQNVTATETTDGKLNDLSCSVFSSEVVVDGKLSDLVDFATRLKTDFGNSVIDSVNITVPSSGAPDTTTTTSTESTEGSTTTAPVTSATTTIPPDTFEADIAMTVYVYKGN